ncbi:protein kinase, partial [Streptomyces sp. NPDC051133]|uniref:protein kinase domain-containing protein n=1 Tax=Streptomyces sp. NPDC051133 TaxID=3155521 RepID=UPI0034282A06
MSTTALARREDSNLEVVIKYLFREGFSGADALDRVRNDTETLCLVTDLRLARVYAYRVGARGIAVISEFVSGENLRQILSVVGSLGPSSTLCLILECLQGIAALHEVGVAHRNLKPESVMILPDGEVKLLGATLRGDIPAETAYENDAYSVGALLIECLVGRPGSEISEDELSDRFGADAEAVESLLCVTRWAMTKSRTEQPLSAVRFIGLLDEWADAVLGPGWEERGKAGLAAAAQAVTPEAVPEKT